MARCCGSPSSSSLSCLVLVLLLLLPMISYSCPLLRRRPCDAANSTDPADWQCGDHVVRCTESEWQIQFYGEGQWGSITDFSYEERVLVVKDPGVNSRLSHHDCGLVYSFAPPAPPLPRPLPFQNSLLSGLFVFNCDVGEYNFSSDVFAAKAYGSRSTTGCTGFDLYYAFEYEGQPLRGVPWNCTGGGNFFEWRLRFDESGRNLSVLSAGFSHQRALHPDCFSCRMSREDCSPVGLGNAATCSCSQTCADASSKMSTPIMKIIVGAVLSGFLSLGISILYCSFQQKLHELFRKWRSRNVQDVEDFLEHYGSQIPKRYDYSDVKKMTQSFSKELGHGGYGKVFKGQLRNGRLVAVKLLNESQENGEEFVNEVASIGRTYHINIASLLGFCSEGKKRALIYEFMPNGSLEKFIFSKLSRDQLGWKKIYEIAMGIARGLEYLHRGCGIIHFDIKPHNILLDKDFCPKISDFGLAKLCRPKESILSMAGIRGTIGYIAPEVFSRNFGVISTKSDVYSYGMMVLEMVSQRKNVDARLDNVNEVYFPHWVYEQLVNGGHCGIHVPTEAEEHAKKMIIVGLWCIQTSPRSRPSMTDVLEMLEGSIEDLEIPPKPYLLSPTTSFSRSSTYSQSS